VTARRAVVDATYMETRVPATEPPPFEVAAGVACVPVGELTKLQQPYERYVVIGAGKTGMDAVCWLLDQGEPADRIRWIRPRDFWILNRKYFQPGSGIVPTFEGVVVELEAVAASDSIDEVYERMEQDEVVLRIDPSVRPTLLRGGTASKGELEQLRRVEDVVRLGYVKRIVRDAITLTEGSVPTDPHTLHIHCAAPGLTDKPSVPIWGDGTITLQPISRLSLSLGVSLIGFVESSDRTTAEKNALCPPNSWPHTAFDFLRHILVGIRTEAGWQDADLVNYVEESRLNLLGGIAKDPDHATVSALQGRFITAMFPALEKLDLFASQATPAEQARIFNYV
jgi:hypothetical protein